MLKTSQKFAWMSLSWRPIRRLAYGIRLCLRVILCEKKSISRARGVVGSARKF